MISFCVFSFIIIKFVSSERKQKSRKKAPEIQFDYIPKPKSLKIPACEKRHYELDEWRPTATVNSPQWSKKYPKSLACAFSVRAPINQQIVVTVKKFNVEGPQHTGDCTVNTDNLIIFSSKNCEISTLSDEDKSSVVLGPVCGVRKKDTVWETNRNRICVFFKSDDDFERGKFSLAFSFKKKTLERAFKF